MKVIYGAAGLFILLALWTAWQAFLLVPTDLGNSYLVATSVLFSTAGLMIVLGIVGQRIIREIRNRPSVVAEAQVTPMAPLAPTVAMPEPVVQHPVVQAPVLPEPMPEPFAPPKSRPVAPILAGAAAGVAAGAVLGGAMRTPPESAADTRLLEDFERDLFADLRAIAPEPDKPEPAVPVAETRLPEPEPALEPIANEPELPELPPIADVVLGDPEDSALPPPARETAADTGEDDDLVLPPLPPLPSFGLPEPTPSEAEIRAIEDAAHDDDDVDDEPVAPVMAEPELLEPEPVPPAPVSPTPGLIHDEDLAALSDAVADLAPLETLDVVGAYDSGGTRFTMYSDGSVTAKGEGVDRRFRSLDDLRAFIDGGMRG